MADRTVVLLVEDNPLNRELAVDVLEVAGFEVHTAESAEECLRIVPDLNPPLILMDIGLPGMDGLEATRRLRADPTTAHIPVVAVTSHVMMGQAAEAIAAGCVGHLSKPIDTRTFAATVRGFLQPGGGR